MRVGERSAALSLYVKILADLGGSVTILCPSFYNTPRVSPFTIGNYEERHIQPIRNKRKVKNRF
jgi:hypothetical protein